MVSTRRSILTYLTMILVAMLALTGTCKGQSVGDTIMLDSSVEIECRDGDSCPYPGLDRDIRLAGIDAPEIDGPCPIRAKLAKAELERVLSYRPHQTVIVDIGKYDRYIVEIRVGNLNVSNYMLTRNLATRWPVREPSTLCGS